jgi:ribonuclease Z
MGERDKPLEIYYHKSSELIRNYIDFILQTGNKLKYELSVHEIDTGEEIDLTDGNGRRYIKVFKTDHMKSEVSVGYQIRENRKRLKEEYKGFEHEQIKKIVLEKGKDFITERYSYSLMTLSGDGNVISDEYMSDTNTLVHECTFLDAEDRRGDKHTEINELLLKIKINKPKKVILYHISNRYIHKLRETMKKLEKELNEEGIEFFYVYPGKVCRF